MYLSIILRFKSQVFDPGTLPHEVEMVQTSKQKPFFIFIYLFYFFSATQC